MRYFLAYFVILLSLNSCNDNSPLQPRDENKLPKSITFYSNGASDSLVVYLYKSDTKPYFDSIIRVETDGTVNVTRYNYSRYSLSQIMYKSDPVDSADNIWVMQFADNTFANEYRFYNIYINTFTDDLIETHELTADGRFSAYLASSSGSGGGLNFYCTYDPAPASKMNFFYANFSPSEKRYECTYTAYDNNTQLVELSGIEPYVELYGYPYPGLNMKLVDRRWFWDNFSDTISYMFEQYHYTFDSRDRVVYAFADVMYRNPSTGSDSLVSTNVNRRRFEY